MNYLSFVKLQLKSFNVIKATLYKQKLIGLNYITFFFNFRFLLNLYKQIKVLYNLVRSYIKLMKQFIKITKASNIFLLLNKNNSFQLKLIILFNKLNAKLSLITILLKMKKYKFNFYFKLLNTLVVNVTKLPVKLKKFTILKSPHIFKKHRDQYQINYYKYFINFIIFDLNNNLYHIFNNLRFQSYIESSLIIKKFYSIH